MDKKIKTISTVLICILASIGVYAAVIDFQTPATGNVIEVGSPTNFVVKSDGNVGVGTNNPEGMVHIKRYGNTQLKLGHTNQPELEWFFDVDATSKMTLQNENRGTQKNVMTFDANNGNVGIGTNNPAVKLDIGPRHTTGDPQGYKANIRLGGGHVITNHANGALVLNAGPDNGEGLAGIYFRKDNTLGDPSLFTELMFIKSDGKVGIGTNNPAYQLDVGGPMSGIALDGATTSPDAGVIRFGDNTGWKLHFGRAKESSTTSTYNTGTTGVLMSIQDNGNVGIGTDNPQQKLHVAGSIVSDSMTETEGITGTTAYACVETTTGRIFASNDPCVSI